MAGYRCEISRGRIYCEKIMYVTVNFDLLVQKDIHGYKMTGPHNFIFLNKKRYRDECECFLCRYCPSIYSV